MAVELEMAFACDGVVDKLACQDKRYHTLVAHLVEEWEYNLFQLALDTLDGLEVTLLALVLHVVGHGNTGYLHVVKEN